MRSGKVASMILLCLLVILATLVGLLVDWLTTRGADGLTATLVIAGSLGLILAGVLLPVGWSLDRSLAALETSIETIGGPDDLSDNPADDDASIQDTAAGEQPNGPLAAADVVATLGPPKWLLPITHAFTAAADRFHQRERRLRNRLREIEIRHHVSEAERRQVEQVLHALRDPVIVTNAFNEITMINEAAAALFQRSNSAEGGGAGGGDLAGTLHRPIEHVIPDQRLCRLIRDTREAGNLVDCRNVEIEIECCSPATLPAAPTVYDVTLSCIENHNGCPAGVVAILRDLTRERELAQMKTDFVSKASHELRTPLSSIRGYVEMLVDGEIGDDQSPQHFYRIIQDETERLGRLIDNMLNISRIEAGIVQIERESVDMKSLVDRAIDTLGPQADAKSISLIAKHAAVDLCVEGDGDMLYQVVLNLVSNAVKYTPDGGRVTITSDTDNLTQSVVTTVADTGLGIPPDALPRLFDKFYRVENYKRIAKGTGLGLSLCRHIVETLHQGQIGVESRLGLGSRFWYSIPMRYAGTKAAA